MTIRPDVITIWKADDTDEKQRRADISAGWISIGRAEGGRHKTTKASSQEAARQERKCR
jgi:hypothetical protein